MAREQAESTLIEHEAIIREVHEESSSVSSPPKMWIGKPALLALFDMISQAPSQTVIGMEPTVSKQKGEGVEAGEPAPEGMSEVADPKE